MKNPTVLGVPRSCWLKDNTIRFCIDYRKLDEVTVRDSRPLPRIDATLDALSGSKIYSTIDLKSGYWQVKVNPEDREKTAFSVPGGGHWNYVVMPLGLCNAGATFQRLIEKKYFQTCPGKYVWYIETI